MTSTIDIDVELLGEVLPMLTSVCRVVGSAEGPNEKTVRLRIEGESVPPGHVRCEVTKLIGKDVAQLNLRFKPYD